jgi:zinc-ribbon domain
MQYCEECGAELPENALFCGRCGRKTTSDNEITTHENSTLIEDISESPSSMETASNDSQDTTSSSEEEQQQQTPDMPPENDTEAEERTSYVTSEYDSEEQTPNTASEKQQEQQAPFQISEHENEEQLHQQDLEQSNLVLDNVTSEPEILTNHISQEQPELTQNSIAQQEPQSPNVSVQKSKSRPVSKCLLFSLVALVILLGGVFMMVGMFHLNLPGSGGNSQAVSSSSYNEIINPTGSSLTASICANTSTPSSSASNQRSTFILDSSSGCSTVTALKTVSSCLIFPNPSGGSHQIIVDVSNASIGSKPYHLVFSVVDYSGPTTYNDARHVTVGLGEGSTDRNFTWFYRSGSISINSDEQSGAIDVLLGQKSSVNTLHIRGNWACGHLLKNS